MSPLRIEEIEFKDGPKCKVPRILLLVGPNGSGKSLALSEIYRLLYKRDHEYRSPEIISAVNFELPRGRSEALKLLSTTYMQNPSEPEIFRVLACNNSGDIKDVAIHPQLFELENQPELLRQGHLREALMDTFVVFPRLQTILTCLENKQMQVMTEGVQPNNIHQLFLKYPFKRNKVNALLRKTFNKSICVELQNNGELRFVISRKEIVPTTIAINPSHDEQQFFKECRSYTKFGDGFKVFAGLVTLVFSCDHRILLLDEPELYLHAPLIRKLAQELVGEFEERDGTIVAATHSADFVAGCLEATDDVAIVRLSYSEDTKVGAVSIVDHEMLKRFIRNPVLRNLDALPGLFYEAVVIVEGQNDKIAYSEVNRRLVQHKKGIRDVLFIGATGKTGLLTLGEPFARSGIPTALVYDFDALLDQTVPRQIEEFASIYATKSQQTVLAKQMAACIQTLQSYSKEDLKKVGTGALTKNHASQVKSLLAKLASFGVFIVPLGEVESWFLKLGFPDTGRKNDKLTVAMEGLPSKGIPHDLSDSTDSVWAFVHHISEWVQSCHQKQSLLQTEEDLVK
jgi:energy-coupling factor transporter ATP-binding protein EcfA2